MHETCLATRRRAGVLPLSLTLLAAMAAAARADSSAPVLSEDDLGVPFRVRDYTFPSFLVLGFAPMPAAPLGKGRWAVEMHGSIVNDFQVSPSVEEYLAERPGPRRALDSRDVDAILRLPEGEAFYIDGEFNFFDMAFYYGVSERLDVGVALSAINYTGGRLDASIFDFHESLGYGQQGRDFVRDHNFQVVFGNDDLTPVVALERPTAGGLSDPSIYLRYGFPVRSNGWRYGLVAGIKPPMADVDDFLSSGGWDIGAELTADRRWRRNAFIFNFSLVSPGRFQQNDFKPPLLPSIHLTWIHGFGRTRKTRVMLQGLVAEHPFRDLVDSDLTELEVQLTLAFKVDTNLGVFGIGLTENLFNMDNTPDIGLHLSWGMLVQP